MLLSEARIVIIEKLYMTHAPYRGFHDITFGIDELIKQADRLGTNNILVSGYWLKNRNVRNVLLENGYTFFYETSDSVSYFIYLPMITKN